MSCPVASRAAVDCHYPNSFEAPLCDRPSHRPDRSPGEDNWVAGCGWWFQHVSTCFNMFQYVSTFQKICWHPRDWNMIVETTNQTFSQELLANAKKLLKIIAFVLRSGE